MGAGAAPVSWKSVADFLHHKYYCAHACTHTHLMETQINTRVYNPNPCRSTSAADSVTLSLINFSSVKFSVSCSFTQLTLNILYLFCSLLTAPNSSPNQFLSLLYPNLFLYLISSFPSFSFIQWVPLSYLINNWEQVVLSLFVLESTLSNLCTQITFVIYWPKFFITHKFNMSLSSPEMIYHTVICVVVYIKYFPLNFLLLLLW